MVDVDRTAEVLAERARLLARPLATAEQERATVQAIGFETGGDRFVLPVESVVTVIAAIRTTPLPGVPSWVVGAAGVQGRVMAVVSLAAFLGTRPAPDEAETGSPAIVAAHDGVEVALLIDRVEPVESFEAGAILALPAGSSELVRRVARGTVGGRLFLDPVGLISALRSAPHPFTDDPSPVPDHRPNVPN